MPPPSGGQSAGAPSASAQSAGALPSAAQSAPIASASPAAAQPSSAATNAAAGSWSIILSGPRPGAGTYSGNGRVLCAAASFNGSGDHWTASGILLSPDIAQLSLLDDDAFDSVLVQTPGGIETGQWFFRSDQPDMTAQVTGSGDATGAHVSAHATFKDMQGKVYTADVSVECSQVGGDGGTD